MSEIPAGFRLVADPSLRRLANGHLLAGGVPPRMLRLTDAGRDRAAELLRGDPVTRRTGLLARRLLDAGLAHPRPPATARTMSATAIVPVRDRPEQLDACLSAIGNGPSVIVVDDGSRDAAAVARVCRRHGAELLRLPLGRGPGVARSAALPKALGELIAFVDSDAAPQPGWLEALGRHFADPAVGAAAPRIRPAERRSRSLLARYAERASPLDLGDTEGPVGPGRRVPYVPTATIVIRREALSRTVFDADLRYGEDVDLVWRLVEAGWVVRYDPSVVARHHEPSTWRAFLGRRHSYGRSAAPLSARHPRRIVHVVIAPLPLAAGILAMRGARRSALVVMAAQSVILVARTSRAGAPVSQRLGWAGTWLGRAFVAFSRAAIMFAAPVLIAGLFTHGTRRPAIVLLLAAPTADYLALAPRISPTWWLAARVADEFAYGTGVLRGCAETGTFEPLRPRWPWGANVREVSALSPVSADPEPRTPPGGGD